MINCHQTHSLYNFTKMRITRQKSNILETNFINVYIIRLVQKKCLLTFCWLLPLRKMNQCEVKNCGWDKEMFSVEN